MIIKSAPIVPSDEDCSIEPIPRTAVAVRAGAKRIDDGCHPRGTVSWRDGRARIIRVLPRRNYPAHPPQVAVRDVR